MFTNHCYRIAIKWITRKGYLFYVTCKGKCSCGEDDIGETKRNVEKHWSEYENPTEKNEPARHLFKNIAHLFAWEILMPAPKGKRPHKNLEAFLLQFKNNH